MALGINLLHYSFDYAALSHYGGVSRRINIQNGKWDGLILVCPWSWAASASARSTLDESHPFTVFWFLFFMLLGFALGCPWLAFAL